MEQINVKLAEGGRLVIPARFRKALGLRPGDEVALDWQDDRLVITSRATALRRAQAAADHYKQASSEVDALIAERRAEAADD